MQNINLKIMSSNDYGILTVFACIQSKMITDLHGGALLIFE